MSSTAADAATGPGATARPFTGFSPDAIQFLADLAENNDRAWFQPRKAEFDRLLKQPMEALVAAISHRFEARGIPLAADPRRGIFRIYRDTRFSKDKSPYKRHYAATFPWVGGGAAAEAGGNPSERAHTNGGYFNFQPGDMYVGGGMWHPDRPRLDAFRRAVVERPDEVRAAIEDARFVATFGNVNSEAPLRRVPPGFPADHPLAELLKLRDVVFGRRLSDADVLSPALPDTLADAFEAALPVFRLLATLG